MSFPKPLWPTTTPPLFEMRPHRLFLILTACYALFILWVDILPLHPILPWTEAQSHIFWEKPFRFHISSRSDFVGNILFFVPFGFFLATAMGRYFPCGIWAKRCLQVAVGIFSGLTLSALAESVQAFLPMRVSSWMDLIANTAGAAGGAIAGSLVSGNIFQRLGHRYRMVSRTDPALCILIIYVMMLFFIALVPFDIAISPWNIYYKWKNGFIILWPSNLHSPGWQVWLRLLIKQMPWYLPLGALCAYILKSRSRLSSAGIVWAISVGTTLYTLFLECLQLIIRTRTTSLPDALCAGAASALGALALTVLYRQSAKSKQIDLYMVSAPCTALMSILLLTGYSLLVLCVKLQPFDFIFDPMAVKQKLDAFNFIPFMGYVRGGSSDPGIILFDLAREGLLYLPVGLIISFAMKRAFSRAANKTVFGIALFIGCIVSGTGEIGQIFVVSRYPDITDILLGACGAGVGSLLQKNRSYE